MNTTINTPVVSISEKFNSLVNGGLSVSGTPHDVRAAIWDEFRAEYSEELCISIDRVKVTLSANHSLSGKSTSYIGHIEAAEYTLFNGASKFGLSTHHTPYVTIQNGTVEVHGGGKYYFKIANNRVTILN